MIEVFDFLINALPWITIGLFVACSCVMTEAGTEGKGAGRFFKVISRFPAVCFLFTAVMEMCSGNRSGGITWVVLGAVTAVISIAYSHKDRNKQLE